MDVFPSLQFGEPDTVNNDTIDNSAEAKFGDGYGQYALLGINARRMVRTLSWTRADGNVLYEWLWTRKKNVIFIWSMYGDTKERKWRCTDCKSTPPDRHRTTVTATFEEEFTI